MPKLAPWWPLTLSMAALLSLLLSFGSLWSSPGTIFLRELCLTFLAAVALLELLFRASERNHKKRIESNGSRIWATYDSDAHRSEGGRLILSDAAYAQVQLSALYSRSTAIRQAINLGNCLLSVLSSMLMAVPTAAFWIVVAIVVTDPSAIEIITSATPEQLANAGPLFMSVLGTYAIIVVAAAMILRPRPFGFINCYRAAMLTQIDELDRLNQDIPQPGISRSDRGTPISPSEEPIVFLHPFGVKRASKSQPVPATS